MAKPKKARTVKICPICHSQNVTIYMGATTGIRYQCKDCGYIGVLIVEKEVE